MSPRRPTQVPPPSKQDAPPTYLVTGYPGMIGRRLVEELVRDSPESRVYALSEAKNVEEAQKLIAGIPGSRVQVLSGDVVDMHLGLSSEEYAKLCDEVTHIFHLAAVSYLGAPKDVMYRVNVEGTRTVLELARDCRKLERLSHFSSCYVSGDRVGVIMEDELDAGQSFRNPYEETKFQAEMLLQRAMPTVPISIYRPASIVGDTRTGEIDRFEGPYYLGIFLVASPLVAPLPLPGNGVAPLNVVPLDFVVDAVTRLTRDPRAAGKTFHLVDPNPLSARRVYEMIAERANKKLPRFNLSAKAADVMLRLPFIERLTRPQRAAISYINHLAIYNSRNTLSLLDGTGIQCPPISEYLDTLIAYVREHYRRRREARAAVEDPLDAPESESAEWPRL